MRLGREQSRPPLPNAQPFGQTVVLDEGGILAVRGAESRRKAFILQVLMKALDLSVLMPGRQRNLHVLPFETFLAVEEFVNRHPELAIGVVRFRPGRSKSMLMT